MDEKIKIYDELLMWMLSDIFKDYQLKLSES